MTSSKELQSSALAALLDRAVHDPGVVGLVLTGSQARVGMATSRSDIDVYVALSQPDEAWRTTRSATIDVPVCTLGELSAVPGPDAGGWWDRLPVAQARPRHPLEREGWQAQILVPQLEAILDDGDPAAQRALFSSVEEAAREVGFAPILDDWGDELAILRGA